MTTRNFLLDRGRGSPDPSDEGGKSFVRGVMFAAPLCALFWLWLIWYVWW
jgi:hypothetical protein